MKLYAKYLYSVDVTIDNRVFGVDPYVQPDVNKWHRFQGNI